MRVKRNGSTIFSSRKRVLADRNARYIVMVCSFAFRMCLLNVRSARNKGVTVKDFTVDHDLDALIITETWLGTLYPTGYRFLHVPRYDNTTFGGGIG